jgi:GTPase SAR1 family protein
VFEAVRSQATIKIQAALAVGEKEWNRSKIMLVGEGRAGKTALAKSFMGLPFEHTESTCGIEQFRVEVSHAVVGPVWQQSEAPHSELDVAVVALAKASTSPGTQCLRVAAETPSTADIAERSNNRLELSLLAPEKVEHIRSALLSDNVLTGSDLMVRLYDFAGQDVFSSLHSYFLTRHGVYVIVFTMNWLVTSEAHSTAALEYLSFWLDSIAVHTKSQKQELAPIFLAGTHKDQVPDVEAHGRISLLLDAKFGCSAAWPAVVENDVAGLVFFPVDCTLGAADPTTVLLMLLTEQSIRQSDYVSIKRPLSWYKTLDALQSLPCPMVSLSVATKMAEDCGVSSDQVNRFLEFVRDMGLLMWYDEPELRETVILDPVAYFVMPVTRVICQLEMHLSDIHRRCRKQRREEFDILFSAGIASPDILHDLLISDGYDVCTLITLMLKYGLAVCWQRDGGDAASVVGTRKYLIPSLFPEAPSSLAAAKEWVEDKTTRTMYFVFSLANSVGKSILKESDLSCVGFLPKGLFSRLLCASLEWCHETSGNGIDLSQFTLCRSFAIMQVGGSWLRMTLVPANHCIRVDVVDGRAGADFPTVIDGLWHRWRTIVKSSYKSLTIMPFMPYLGHADYQLLFVPIALEGTCPNATVVANMGSPTTAVDKYHVFLSYRWGDFEKQFVVDFYNHLRTGMVRGHQMRVFLDSSVFKKGDRLQKIMLVSVLSSEVFVPLVTPTALQRLICHDPQEVDSLLFEWLTALLLITYHDVGEQLGSVLRYICPICFKGANGDGYFAVKAKLSAEVPVATIRALKELLDSKNVVLSPKVAHFLDTVSVKYIVDNIMASLAVVFDALEVTTSNLCASGEAVMPLFFETDELTVPAEYMVHRTIAGPSVAGASTV